MENKFGAVSLGDIIRDKEFKVPMYQRNYKWNVNLAKKLTDDIISCYKNKDVKKSVGLLTLYEHDGKYDVIDGQQRFTTLAILLACLGCDKDKNINLHYERDNQFEPRYNAIFCKNTKCEESESTDVNRIMRNKKAIEEVISQKLVEEYKEALVDYILDNVIMLCSVVSNQPVEEFMNLNAYKTRFSVCDYVRANLIALNSFHKEEMEEKETNQILSWCLSNHSYKTAVAVLYNDIQKKLYKKYNMQDGKQDGKYKSIYELLTDKKLVDAKVIINPQNESRINIIFRGMLDKNSEDYYSEEITKNFDYWIKMLQKLAYVNKLLDELEEELSQEEFHSFKQIDDYQSSTKKSFIMEVFEGISTLDEEWDSQTLARELQKYSNVSSVLIRYLEQDSKKLANRYLEAFVYSSCNHETNKKADNESRNRIKLPQMTMADVVSEISGCGRYIIDRYEREHRSDLNINISIPPVVDLEDRENAKFGAQLDELKSTDDISVENLFRYNIVIPVIQRDYCMGARITGENDFLAFLLNGFSNNNEINASTVLLSVSENKENEEKTIYIFDGQQRTFTLYNILEYCGVSDLKRYDFVGRNKSKENKCVGSPYSKEAVEHLHKILDNILKEKNIDKENFAKYIKEKVFLKVKTVDSISGAEQFFMDINGGVKLNEYEIYKALLCNKLSTMEKGSNIVKKIENEWLNFFYKFRKNYLNVTNIKSDESDKEELLEIRFIEHVCRFVYRKNHFGLTYNDIYIKNPDSEEYTKKEDELLYGNKTNEPETELLIFDEIESKSEIVTKLEYVNRMNENDISEIEKIMNSIAGEKNISLSDNNLGVTAEQKSMQLSSSKSNTLDIIRLIFSGNKENVLKNQGEYISRFIWSLDDDNREIIKNYYRYKNISGLKKIYDEDQIMRDIFLKICLSNSNVVKGDTYPYALCWNNFTINIYGGYKNKSESREKKYVKEIPAYYWKNIIKYKENKILREAFLYEKFKDTKDIKELNLALVGTTGISYDDGTPSNIVQIKDKIIYKEVVDSQYGGFCIDGDKYIQYFTTRSAYIFKYDAYKYLKKNIINPPNNN